MDQMDAKPLPRGLLEAIAAGEADLAAGRVEALDVDALCQEIEAEAEAEEVEAGSGTPDAASRR